MGDLNKVCCMCGDVGFPDKLFRCARCSSRFQHSYCSDYYEDGGGPSTEAAGTLCDWCRSDERNASRAHPRRRGSGSRRPAEHAGGEKGKQGGGGGVGPEEGDGGRGRNSTGAGEAGIPTRPPPGRRYKLLKDVLC